MPVEIRRPAPDTLRMTLSGRWELGSAPSAEDALQELAAEPPLRRLTFESGELEDWDSTLLGFLTNVKRACEEREIAVEPEGLPEGARRMLALAAAVPEQEGRQRQGSASPLAQLGSETIGFFDSAREIVDFLGEATLALLKFFSGRARMRRRDFALVLQEAGPQALPIVGLLSMLIGLILAYVGATQLRQFGAEIYVADLVGVGMAREMGAMMTAIIMAGRTGAAFAAQLGTMQANEEVDALKTLGFSEIEFLVLPRLLALGLMMPLLYVYSVLLGIVGGAVVGVGTLDLGFLQYFEQTRGAMALHHCAVGLVKATIFGALVALAGCLRGIRSGRSSAAVGSSTTSAVVTAIIWIIATDAILNVLFDVIGV